MRNIHELLLLLQKKATGYPLSAGLCLCARELNMYGIITDRELFYMAKYIERNRPSTHTGKSAWWYVRGVKQPRLEWIEHHLQINKKR
jgi:hypothetical protein